MAVLGLGVDDSWQRLNAVKNVVAVGVNGVAALLFALCCRRGMGHGGRPGAGAIVGGQVGASVGRRLPDWALRGVIVLIGVVAVVAFV
jgi:uncharacterized membrane protein YfcA